MCSPTVSTSGLVRCPAEKQSRNTAPAAQSLQTYACKANFAELPHFGAVNPTRSAVRDPADAANCSVIANSLSLAPADSGEYLRYERNAVLLGRFVTISAVVRWQSTLDRPSSRRLIWPVRVHCTDSERESGIRSFLLENGFLAQSRGKRRSTRLRTSTAVSVDWVGESFASVTNSF